MSKTEPYLPPIWQMRLQIHMHIHIGIFNSTNGLDVIQSKTLWYLPEIRRWHCMQKPRHHLLNRPGLLLCQFMNHGSLGDTLDVNVLRCLPGSVVGGCGALLGWGCGEV